MADVFANAFPATPAAADYPSINDVRLGVEFDSGNLTGTVRLPVESDVRLNTTYDSNDSRTGTLDPGAGGTIPSADDVRLGVDVGATTGNLLVPATIDVRSGTSCDSSDSLTGSLDVFAESNLPAENDVRSGTVYGDTQTGGLDLPSVDDVRLNTVFDSSSKVGTVREAQVVDVREGVVYGANDTLTGTLVVDVPTSPNYPAEAEVLNGVQFGTLGAEEFTGNITLPQVIDVRDGTTYGSSLTVEGTLTVPSPNDVRLNVAYDQTIGNVTLPIEGDVRAGTFYDSSLGRTGTLDTSGDPPVFPAQSDVRLGVTYGTESSPEQFTGDVRVPPVENVLVDYAYDTADSLTGTLEPGCYPDESDVRAGVVYGCSSEFVGSWSGGGGTVGTRGWVG